MDWGYELTCTSVKFDGENNTKDATFFLFLKQLQQNNIGIKYTFWSNATSKTVMFVLSPSTLRTCIKDQL